MDIGNEISHKIRDAIKAKLVDLGAYVDEELPDYIMVMIANKKTTMQMRDDLQLFLGNNTERFATWLDAVLHKLQSATVEASLTPTPTVETDTLAAEQLKKTRKGKDSKTVKSLKHSKVRESGPEELTEDISSAAALHEQEPSIVEEEPVRPDDPSQAIITLTPETGDIFDEELNPEIVEAAPEKQPKPSPVAPPQETQVSEVAPMQRSQNISPIVLEKPCPPVFEKPLPDRSEESQVLNDTEEITVTHISTSPMSVIGESGMFTRTVQTAPTTYRATKKIQSRLGVRVHRSGMHEGGGESRKYMSVVGQVIEDEEDVDTLPVTKRGLTSVVKPKRRPTLPLSKQANKSLLVRAMSDAQRSTITELQRQRSNAVKIVRPNIKSNTLSRNLISRAISDAAMSEIQTRIQQNPRTIPDRDHLLAKGLISKSKSSEKIERDFDNNRYQSLLSNSRQDEDEVISDDQDDTVHTVRHIDVERELEDEGEEDQRIMKISYADERVVKTTAKVSPVHKIKETDIVPLKPVNNPKFIVTLAGAEGMHSSPKKAPKRARVLAQRPVTRTICKQGVDSSLPLYKATNKDALLIQRVNQVENSFESLEDEGYSLESQVLKQGDVMGISPRVEPDRPITAVPSQLALKVDQVSFSLHDSEDEEVDDISLSKRQKLLERCVFWPACKNGDTCSYVHPTTKCVTFPNCKFGDKCLYIHPNCKFDATCSRSDCPYTHATRKQPGTLPTPTVKTTAKHTGHGQIVCKFHPVCKNASCPFHHPKPCRFGAACTRPDCIFSHHKVVTGSALKWTKSVQKSSLFSSIPKHITL